MPKRWIIINRDNLAVGEKLREVPDSVPYLQAIMRTDEFGPDAVLVEEVHRGRQVAQPVQARPGTMEGQRVDDKVAVPDRDNPQPTFSKGHGGWHVHGGADCA